MPQTQGRKGGGGVLGEEVARRIVPTGRDGGVQDLRRKALEQEARRERVERTRYASSATANFHVSLGGNLDYCQGRYKLYNAHRRGARLGRLED